MSGDNENHYHYLVKEMGENVEQWGMLYNKSMIY